MITREHRFHGRNSLRYVYRAGKTLRSPHLALRYCPNDRQAHYRAAVVVSKKVSKSAVVRNRIRRRLYEILRHHQSEIVKPVDMVLTVYSPLLAVIPAGELEAVLVRLLRQIGTP